MSSFSKFKKSFGFKVIPVFVVAGAASYLLSQLTSVRYEVSAHNRTWGLTKEQLKSKGFDFEEVDIHEEYRNMKENLDIDNWENVRGPRPWEEDEQKYIDIIQKRIEETEAKRKKKGSFWAA